MLSKKSFSPRLILIGSLVGIANVIPGVSGGTIAFIFHVYEALLNALKSFDLESLKLLCRFQFKKLSQKIPLFFLFNFFGGVLLGALTIAKILKLCFEHYPEATWAFFFGLIVASVPYLLKEISGFKFKNLVFLLAGFGFAFALSQGSPLQENAHPGYLLLCGILAISSMIVPGISGSYVLILMGNYPLVLNAVSTLQMETLSPLLLGCGLGFLLFVRIISWLFENYKHESTSTVIGFVTGSLLIIWPWKNHVYLRDPVSQELILRKGEAIVAKNINFFPDLSLETRGAFLIMIAGFACLFFLQKSMTQLKH